MTTAVFRVVMVNRKDQELEIIQEAPIVADYGDRVVVNMPRLASLCRERLGESWFLKSAVCDS